MRQPWTDARKVHLLTRGNVDGITSAALVFDRFPDARVHFVTNATVANQEIRRDLTSERFLLVDLGLTDGLARNLSRKAAAGHEVALVDHHQQTLDLEDRLDPNIDRLVLPGMSAAAVTRRWLETPAHTNEHLKHLAAIADVVEYNTSDDLTEIRQRVGDDVLYEESRLLDFAWRLKVNDDRFRITTARRLAQGAWPSQIPEVVARDTQMRNERRWERAVERVRQRIDLRGNVAVLAFNKRKPSLFGFGARALTEVAREEGCSVAVLVHRRDRVASFSIRLLTHPMAAIGGRARAQSTMPVRHEINLGRFISAFTAQHGIVGGGHPESAGGKIPTRSVGTFLAELEGVA